MTPEEQQARTIVSRGDEDEIVSKIVVAIRNATLIEREACAKLAEEYTKRIAAAIRGRQP